MSPIPESGVGEARLGAISRFVLRGRRFAVTVLSGMVIALTGAVCTSQSVRAETIFVSPNGNDSNDGSTPKSGPRSAGPVRTLERAQAIARTVRAKTAAAAVAFELAGGTYQLERPLVLDSADSGAAGAPLRIYAPGGAQAVLSGGVPITGWKMNSRGELVAQIDLSPFGGTCPGELFVGGVRRSRPRLPAQGTFEIAAAGTSQRSASPQQLSLVARAGDLPQGFVVSPDTEIVIIDAWTASRLRAVSFSRGSRVLTIQGDYRGRKSRPTLEPGLPYYLENQPVAQLQPGQWQCGQSRSELRYRPLPGETATTLSAVAPALINLLSIRGSRANPVQNIVIENVSFEHAGWTLPATGWAAMQAEIGLPAAVQTENCRSIAFRNISVARSGAQGLAIGKNCQDVELADSRFLDLGGGGIQIGSDQRKPMPGSDWEGGPSSRAPTTNVRILRNTLRSLGRIHLGATGIWVGLADHVAIINNRISDLYYSGISVGWIFNDAISPIHDNLIVGNQIEDFGQGVLSDMGGIYTLGRQSGTVVSGNVISNGEARSYGGWGLYADEGSTDITFTDNQVGRTSSEPMFIHNAGTVHLSRNRRLGDSGDLFVCPQQGSMLAPRNPPITFACTSRGDQTGTPPAK